MSKPSKGNRKGSNKAKENRPVQRSSTTQQTMQMTPDVTAAASHAKMGKSKLSGGDVHVLQRALGNKWIMRQMAPGAQRHSIAGAPQMATEDEMAQMSPQSSFGNARTHKLQRHSIAGAPQMATDEEMAQMSPDRSKQSAFGKAVAPGHEQLLQRGWLDSVTNFFGFGSKDKKAASAKARTGMLKMKSSMVPGDGASAMAIQADGLDASDGLTWTISGAAFGSKIDKAGNFIGGTNLGGKEFVFVKVNAAEAKNPGNTASGTIKVVEKKLFQAQLDFPKFISKSYSWPKFLTDNGFGRFDVKYNPVGKVFNIDMGVKFIYKDDPVSANKGIGGIIDNAVRLMRQQAYAANFISQVRAKWGGKYTFSNKREPQSIWGKLNPVRVNLNVKEVKAANAHFKIDVWFKKSDTANVRNDGTASMFKGDDTPNLNQFPNTGKNEIKRLKQVSPPVTFASGSTKLTGAGKTTLSFMADYVKRINNPKFNIVATGHASADGKKDANLKLSQDRAREAHDYLVAKGVKAPHILKQNGVGETGAGNGANWRKVDFKPTLQAGFQNVQDVTPHEFGHMLGLDDEYDSGRGATTDHYALTKKAFGQKYADKVAKVNVGGVTDQESVMEGGSDVRVYHYVTIWDALVKTTLNKALVPNPKLGYTDWKIDG